MLRRSPVLISTNAYFNRFRRYRIPEMEKLKFVLFERERTILMKKKKKKKKYLRAVISEKRREAERSRERGFGKLGKPISILKSERKRERERDHHYTMNLER